MAIIDNYRGIITVFVEFQTPDGSAPQLAEKLKSFYESTTKGYEGLISVNYHVATDSSAVFNYTQWKCEEDFDNFISNKEVQKAISSIGKTESKLTKTKVVFAS